MTLHQLLRSSLLSSPLQGERERRGQVCASWCASLCRSLCSTANSTARRHPRPEAEHMPKAPPIHRPFAGLPGKRPHVRKDDAGARAGRAVYESRRWRERIRPAQLWQFPLCCMCEGEGRTVVAEHVDHITPIRDGGAPFDPANLRSLCKPHHSAVTRTWQNQRKGEPPATPRAPTYTVA